MFTPLPPAARGVIFLGELFSTCVLTALFVGLYFLLKAFNLPDVVYTIFYIVAALTLLSALLSLIFKPTVGFRYYRYHIGEDRITVRHGVFTKVEETLPMRRLQKVTVDAGPLLRLFHLANIDIYSAGGSLTIAKLPEKEAAQIADRLTLTINEMVDSGVAANVR